MHTILKSWEQEYARLKQQGLPAVASRRRFLHGVAGLAGMVVLNPSGLQASAPAKSPPTPAVDNKASSVDTLNEEPWLTFVQVHAHLFPVTADKTWPGGKSPGAQQLNATGYLAQALERPDVGKAEKAFMLNGVKWLNDFAVKQRKQPFAKLSSQDKEWVLRQIEQSKAGERWLSSIMDYLLEALLEDPVYGGNPQGIGWKWLQHTPGFPRPPVNKMYYKLS